MTSNAGADSGRSASGAAVDVTQELERLRAERDAAVAASRHRSSARRVFAVVFVVLFAILLPITVTATWAHRTVLNTDAYVKTVTPIAGDPAVQAAVSRQVTDQIYTALDPQAIIAGALPPKAAFLAGPIANGAKDSVQSGVNKVLASDRFQQLWVNANRFAHAQLVTVLRGDSKTLQTTNGQVVLNLVPLLNAALQNAQGFVSGVVGKPVTLPTLTGNEIPSAACQKISTALNRPVPATCGQIPLFPAKKLDNAQRAVRWFDGAVLALLIITPLLFVAALWVSQRRRRTLLQLTIAGALGLVIVRRGLMWLENQLITAGKPENKAARTSIVHDLLNSFFNLTWWFLLGALVIVAIALLTGPYRWAVAARHGVATGGKKTGHLIAAGVTGAAAGVSTGVKGTAARAQDDSTVAWVRGHFDLLRIAGVVVAILLLLIFSVNFWGFLVIAALAALYEVWLYRLRPPATITLPPSAPPPTPPARPTT